MGNDLKLKAKFLSAVGAALILLPLLAACAYDELPPAVLGEDVAAQTPTYRIGPGDTLNIFVWRNPDLTANVPVRPDGRISVPLLEDVVASGKTPTDLAREIESSLGRYVKSPLVTVIVTNFVGPYTEQVRVVGAATAPRAISYRANMTLLDAMIEVGGLNEFAGGNRSTLVRKVDGKQKQYRVRIGDLIKDGDISANVNLLPGDVIIIPESIL